MTSRLPQPCLPLKTTTSTPRYQVYSSYEKRTEIWLHAPVNTSSTGRLLSVATSIAAICVRKPESEVFACSLAIASGSLEIYLAENHTIDSATSAYLNGILTRLVDLSEEQRNASPPFNDNSFTENVMAILSDALQFTLPKFLHSISRHDHDWDARMAQIEKLDLTVNERSAFAELKERIWHVFAFADEYALQPSDRILRMLATSLCRLHAFVFELPHKDIVATTLQTIDYTLPFNVQAVMAEDLDPADTSPQGRYQYYPLQRGLSN